MRAIKKHIIINSLLPGGLLLSILLGLAMCKKFEPERRLIVLTDTILNAGATSFTAEGSVVFLGEGDIEQHGFCYSENNDPTIDNSALNELGPKPAAGSFLSTFNDLNGNTVYYVRAYARDSYETAYGKVFQVKTTISEPVVRTTAISSITQNSAKSGGTIVEGGGAEITAKGVCWSTNPEPVLTDSHTTDGSGVSSFTSSLEGLNCEVKYFVRAYATNSAGTAYGDTVSFSTLTCDANLPTITTKSASSITETTAMCGGNISDDGGAVVTERGICWSTSTDPGLDDEFIESGSGTGDFTLTITGLSCNTTYYVKAYAKNASGTAYGDQISFITSQCTASLPVLSTSAVTGIGETVAQSGGNITDDGGATVTARGVCWSVSQNPSLTDPHTEDGGGTGVFTSSISGLTGGLNYYVRAYATNASGTAYGDEVSFTTDNPTLPSVITSTVSSITQTSAHSGGNVTNEGSQPVTSRGVCWSTSPGPTISDDYTTDGSGPGSFSSEITGLTCGTNYYVRAYASSAAGIAYGAQESFTTLNCPSGMPEISTSTVSNITPTSAQSGGEVSSEGGSAVTARGVCWSTLPLPTTSDPSTTDGSGPGVFTSNISGLESNTQYYVRAYATNSQGTAYGEEVSFNTNPDMLTDYDGNNYQTVIIGNQTWMSENLKVTHYADGTAIPLVENTSFWDNLTQTDKAYCWNDNNAGTGNIYGGLYTWAGATNGEGSSSSNPSGVQGVCPTGWHLPSDAEWKQLEMFLGMDQTQADAEGWRGSSEGGKIKESGTTHWNSPNTDATNESGFSALPAGHRYDYGTFENVGNGTRFWSSENSTATSSWARSLSYSIGEIYRSSYRNDNGFSVRCVKNE